MQLVCTGLKCQNLVKILTLLQCLLTYLENGSIFKYNIQARIFDLFKFANAVCIGCLSVTILQVFLFIIGKVNVSNDIANIRTDENSSSSRDDIETPNRSESSSSVELSTDDKIHPSGSNEMRFANTEEIRCNHHLFDERQYEKKIYLVVLQFQ